MAIAGRFLHLNVRVLPTAALAAFAALAGCANDVPVPAPAPGQPSSPGGPDASQASGPPATRTTPLVAGRPGRVFVFAGVDADCKALDAPQITIVEPPAKGDITLKPGQETTISASNAGTCLGAKAKGTGVYYTARSGASGTDAFKLAARLSTGETMTRAFSVEIAP